MLEAGEGVDQRGAIRGSELAGLVAEVRLHVPVVRAGVGVRNRVRGSGWGED